MKVVNLVMLMALAPLAAPACTSCGGSDLEGDAAEDGERDEADGRDAPDVASDPDADPVSDHTVDGPDDPTDAAEEVPEECLAQDAAASGPCEMMLPGVKWDGSHCVPLGSGCECAGSDCGALYDTVEECVAARLSCYDVDCEAMPVADDACVDCMVEMFLGAFWNGRECFELHGCGCAGDGCPSAFASLEECEAVQSRCDGVLCTATGGMWFPASAGFCGFICGAPGVEPCAEDSCYCGTGSTFVPGAGCRDDGSCSPADLCRGSRGQWHPASECYCGFTCGVPNDCEACVDSCDCGPHRTFDPEAGCMPDVLCEGAPMEEVCRATGGTWVAHDEACGHFICGVEDFPCGEPGCNCGRGSNFDPVEGCVYDGDCVLREVGQDCLNGCRPGLACCVYCGLPAGCLRCETPCCAGNPYCFDGCPPPPP